MRNKKLWFVLCFLLLLPIGVHAQSVDFATDFSYQGYLEQNGNPVNNSCNMRFSLFDALTGGNQISTTQTLSGVTVTDGNFSVRLDFGVDAFDGIDHYLRIQVDCGTGYQTLSPRQPITPAAYALGMYGLYTVPNTTSPNIIGGYMGNEIEATAFGAVIAGGGDMTTGGNIIYDNFGTISGGSNNVAGLNDGTKQDATNATYVTIGGGVNNVVSAPGSTVAGGSDHLITGANSTIGGGFQNGILTSNQATVAGGVSNRINANFAFIGGGNSNRVEPNADYSVISGGEGNFAHARFSTIGGGGRLLNTVTSANEVFGNFGTIGGGANNKAGVDNNVPTAELFPTIAGGVSNRAEASYTFIGAGEENVATGQHAAIAGGGSNEANGAYSFIGSGQSNVVNSTHGVIGGGFQNNIALSTIRGTIGGGDGNSINGDYSTIPGGRDNDVSADYGFAAGHGATVLHQGSFVWADGDIDTVESPGFNTFSVQAGGGIWFGRNDTPTVGVGRLINTDTGAYLSTSGVWTNSSDRNRKTDFETVDTQAILDTLAQLDLTSWRYKVEDRDTRHIGVMAQDFHAAFGLGIDDTTIGTVDMDGVLFASVQALYEQNQDLLERVENLEAQQHSQPQRNDISPAWLIVAVMGAWFVLRRRD